MRISGQLHNLGMVPWVKSGLWGCWWPIHKIIISIYLNFVFRVVFSLLGNDWGGQQNESCCNVVHHLPPRRVNQAQITVIISCYLLLFMWRSTLVCLLWKRWRGRKAYSHRVFGFVVCVLVFRWGSGIWKGPLHYKTWWLDQNGLDFGLGACTACLGCSAF